MTLAEVVRWEKGAIFRLKSKAQFDYILADLIGISVGSKFSDKIEYPTIEKAYSGLFDEQKEEQKEENNNEEVIAQNNINRFMEFALRHNAMMKKGEEDGS